jgi:hypothetical protein
MSTHDVSPVSTFGAGAATAAVSVSLGAVAAVSQNAVPALSKMSIVGISILFTAFYSLITVDKLSTNTAVYSILNYGCLYSSQTLCQDALLMVIFT